MKAVAWFLAAFFISSVASAAGWSSGAPAVRAAVRRGAPLVVVVVVPLCDNAQINCGAHGLGSPGSLRSNLYWGALYGVPRFFEKKELGYQALEAQHEPEGVLERRAYRRMIPGTRWGRRDKVELLVVLDAVHGARINDAVDRFYRTAASGAQITIADRGKTRRVKVSVSGYAGHNRLMDGIKLPELPSTKAAALPSFVLVCFSERYFGSALERVGSMPLVTTTGYMAPEGYVVEATVRALGEDGTASEVRGAAARAYARWQKMDLPSAAWLFDKR